VKGDWVRCTGISSHLPGTNLEVAFHDIDRRDCIDLAIQDLLHTYGSILALESLKGAHLISLDLVQPEVVAQTQMRNVAHGQDPQHMQAHTTYGRSILRVSQKYGEPDLHFLTAKRNRNNTRPWSGPHWDFYNSLLGGILPPPGPLDQRVNGDGTLTLEVYYTPSLKVLA